MTTKNIDILGLANFEHQIQYLTDMAPINDSFLVNIDSMIQNSSDFEAKYGWSSIGEEAKVMHIWIDGKHYAVHTAYCQYGFMA
jgi:hypothetical protein